MWQCIKAIDVDDDLEKEFFIGNLGANHKLHASSSHSLRLFAGDLDNNDQIDYVLDQFKQGQYRPVYGKAELSTQMPDLNRKFQYFSDFSEASTETIFGKERLEATDTLLVSEFRSGYLDHPPNGYVFVPLSKNAQVAPITNALSIDLDNDTQSDLLLGGNSFNFPPYIGNMDAFGGAILNAYGKAKSTPNLGIDLTGKEVRAIKKLTINNKKYILLVFNNEQPEIFELTP